MNTLSTASDRHAELLVELDAAMNAVAEDAFPGVVLNDMRAQALRARTDLANVAEALIRVNAAWRGRPRRGPTPELRLTVHAEIDARGAWRMSWSPLFASYDDTRAFQNLLVMDLGTGSMGVSVLRFHEISEHLQRVAATRHFDRRGEMQACRAALRLVAQLQDIGVAQLDAVCPYHVQQLVEVGYNGELTQVDLDLKQREALGEWCAHWEAEGPIPLSELRHAVETGLGISTLHKHVRQYAPEQEIGLADVSRAMRQMQNALEHNSAWWRSGPLVPLPASEPLSRVLPPNRRLVQREGSQPRLSPIATRGVEASALVPTFDLRSAMAERIAVAPLIWHFTAGDFIDLVDPDDRKRVLRCLDRMKRASDITPVSKGVYRRTDGRPDPLSGLQALLRDRDEFACPAPGERRAFYTDGRLRSFRYANTPYRLLPEPCPGLCRAASEAAEMEAFLRLALHLSRPESRRTREISKLMQDFPQEWARAGQLFQAVA